jgi:hypothetical protein
MSFDQPSDTLFALLGTAAAITEYVSLYKDLVVVLIIVSDPASDSIEEVYSPMIILVNDIISCIKFWL